MTFMAREFLHLGKLARAKSPEPRTCPEKEWPYGLLDQDCWTFDFKGMASLRYAKRGLTLPRRTPLQEHTEVLRFNSEEAEALVTVGL